MLHQRYYFVIIHPADRIMGVKTESPAKGQRAHARPRHLYQLHDNFVSAFCLKPWEKLRYLKSRIPWSSPRCDTFIEGFSSLRSPGGVGCPDEFVEDY